MSKDSVYYIRTGNKISKPFTINWFVKLLLLAFVLYTVYITFEFFSIIELEKQLAKTQASINDKYHHIALLNAELADVSQVNTNYQEFFDLIEESNYVKSSH
jgi:cell division protein FtsB